MKYNAEKIFADVSRWSKVHTKAVYEEQTAEFKANRYADLQQLVKADDVATEAKEFCESVSEEFKKFGKVRGGDLMNLNYFMIFYVFPTILSEEENGTEICDTLRDTWNSHFGAEINYTDYETLYSGFRTKIFGIPIGKN